MTSVEATRKQESNLDLKPINVLVNQVVLYFKSNSYYINELTFNKREVITNEDGISHITITPYHLKRVDLVESPGNNNILFHRIGMGSKDRDDFFLMQIKKNDYDPGEGHYFDLSLEHIEFPEGKLNNKEMAEFLINRDKSQNISLIIRLERTGKGRVTMNGNNKHLGSLYQILS